MKTTEPFAPRRVSDEIKKYDVTGYLVPWLDGIPQFLCVNGTDDNFLPIFSTEEKLIAGMTRVGYDSIKQIDDHALFFATIPYRSSDGTRIRFMLDPWVNEDGNTRYTELIRDDA